MIDLVKHCEQSIKNAWEEKSKLSSDILVMEGMSSPKGRHLLNNLCDFDDAKYFEVGTWRGSTFCSAMFKNVPKYAAACDNFRLDTFERKQDSSLEIFKSNCSRFLPGLDYKFFNKTCFDIDMSELSDTINVYFYDGYHKYYCQYGALEHFYDKLDNQFVYICDDYNESHIKRATEAAVNDLFNVKFWMDLSSVYNGDIKTWWNGYLVSVLEKK